MRKAFAYLRVSGKSRTDDGSFPRQLEAIEGHAKARNIGIAHVYEENGIPGARDWEYRPAWVAMLAAMIGDGVKTVIIERLERLARGPMMQEILIGDLHKRGLELISVREPDLLKGDPTRILLRDIMGAIAEHENIMLGLKLQGARKHVKQRMGERKATNPKARTRVKRTR